MDHAAYHPSSEWWGWHVSPCAVVRGRIEMGQGIYRAVGFGCVNPPMFDWDSDVSPPLFDVVRVECEAEPSYVMIPFGVDDGFLQLSWGLPPLPEGLPNIKDRTAKVVKRCDWWPDVGKKGIWVPRRIEAEWDLIRVVAKSRGWKLPEGKVIFVSDWD